MIPIHVDFLNKLQKLKQTKNNEWVACCPVHDDKNPSMHIKISDEGDLLLHCFGCHAPYLEILGSLGFDAFDFIPEQKRYKKHNNGTYIKTQISGESMLQILDKKLNIIMFVLQDMVDGVVLGADEMTHIIETKKIVDECVAYINRYK